MTASERYLLDCLSEECAEVIQRISKAQRFGLYEVQRGQLLNNRERIVGELNDLFGALEACQDANILPKRVIHRQAIADKKMKIMKYMDYAHDIGAMK